MVGLVGLTKKVISDLKNILFAYFKYILNFCSTFRHLSFITFHVFKNSHCIFIFFSACGRVVLGTG